MRKIIAIMAVSAFLALCVVPAIGDESDASELTTYRYSEYPLWHATARATESSYIDNESAVVYEEGDDESMKEYIADPANVTPKKGVGQVREGRTYEVYVISPNGSAWISGFDYLNLSKVLEAQPNSDLDLDKDTYMDFTLKSSRSFNGNTYDYCYLETVTKDGSSTRWIDVDVKVRISMAPNTEELRLTCPDWRDPLYFEIVAEVEYHTLTGSPIVYGSICAAITAAIIVAVFYCGRNPNIG